MYSFRAEMAAQATLEVNQVEEDENFGPQPIQRLEVCCYFSTNSIVYMYS